jgi:hypothetical protein
VIAVASPVKALAVTTAIVGTQTLAAIGASPLDGTVIGVVVAEAGAFETGSMPIAIVRASVAVTIFAAVVREAHALASPTVSVSVALV